MEIEKIKKDYQRERDAIFGDPVLRKDAFRFCVKYSMLVEEYIVKIAGDKNFNFAIASAGSFNRRELSPCSDIDVMFIASSIEGNEEDIRGLIRDLWDCGIEVSHTIRDFYDIEKYILDDLHTFTQFFETRFLLGSEKVYKEWHQRLLSSLESADVNQLIYGFFNDINSRYEKFGDSSKTLEPNVKMSAGGLRDFQAVEWIYTLRYKCFLTDEKETTQAESFMDLIRESKRIFPNECEKILESYKFILSVRNALHLTTGQRNDRLEFDAQSKVAKILDYKGNDAVQAFMKRYFEASTAILRFSKTMLKRFEEEISHPLSDYLAVELDQDFILKGNDISVVNKTSLTLADILRAFYYRGLYSARFDENLRSLSIESIRNFVPDTTITARTIGYFRDILRLPKNTGDTLVNMNELGILGAFLPEFRELVGFFQPGVYHCYTADEHTLIAIKNLEALRGKDTPLARLFDSCKEKELLYMSVLLHDIAKPISVSGHEIIGSEMAATIMHRFGYEDVDVDIVRFLVNKHLMMEQTAFRRNLNDPATLKNFASNFDSIIKLDLLYLLTYADLSAVNPMIWTQWKADLLHELYRKAYDMIKAQISGEELLYSTAYEMPGSSAKGSENAAYQDHIDLFYDAGYAQHFTKAEIESHIAEIEKNAGVSVFFKELNGFSNITIIAMDSASLLSRLCGALSINDLNIHDAKIFTRKDGIVIDSFNVTDFRSHKTIDKTKQEKVSADIKRVVEGNLELKVEINRMRSRWKRLERFFNRAGKINIVFEDHEKYTILDVFSPDRLGLLYSITRKMNELGLSIYFAKISTRADDVVDSFYILDRNGKKVSPVDYELVKHELTETIKELL